MTSIEDDLVSVFNAVSDVNIYPKDIPVLCFSSTVDRSPSRPNYSLKVTSEECIFKPTELFSSYNHNSMDIIEKQAIHMIPIMADELLRVQDSKDCIMIFYPYLNNSELRVNATSLFKDMSMYTCSIKLDSYDHKTEKVRALNKKINRSLIDRFKGYDLNKMPFLGETRPIRNH